MHRSLSTGNKACYQKVVDRNHAQHLERLQAIKRSSSQTFQLQNHNSRIIQTASILRNNNRKKEVQMETYALKVERENKLLLDKMTTIVNNKSKLPLTSLPSIVSNMDPKTKSLNETVRRQEIVKITTENFGILNRIQRQSSVYSVHKWEGDYKLRESYLKNLCEFPILNSLQASPPKSSRKSGKSRGSKSARGSIIIKSSNTSVISPDRSPTKKASPSIEGANKNDSTQKVMLHKKEAKIENHLYSIEFALAEGKLEITLNDMENKNNQSMYFEMNQGKQLMEQNNNNYDQIISKIYCKEDKFQIKGFSEEFLRNNSKIELFDSLPLHGENTGKEGILEEKEKPTEVNESDTKRVENDKLPKQDQPNDEPVKISLQGITEEKVRSSSSIPALSLFGNVSKIAGNSPKRSAAAN